jgi:hypothetical protein
MGKQRKHYYEVCVTNGAVFGEGSHASARKAFKSARIAGEMETKMFNRVWRFLKKHPHVRTHSLHSIDLAIQICRVENNGF